MDRSLNCNVATITVFSGSSFGLGFLYFTFTFRTLPSTPGLTVERVPSFRFPLIWFESWLITISPTCRLRCAVCHFLLNDENLTHGLFLPAFIMSCINLSRYLVLDVSIKGPAGTRTVVLPNMRSFGHK